MTEIRPREPVILAADFGSLVDWYRDHLGFAVARLFDEDYRYCNLEMRSGLRLGIGDAKQAGVPPGADRRGTVVLQLEVDDVRALFERLASSGATITGGPSLDEKGGFWFGSFADPEGNPWWVVDARCP